MASEELSPPWAKAPYSIKRHGTSLTHCDNEPVQTPGCIQSHGTLLALRADDLMIRQVSENSAAWLGQVPELLLGHPVSVVVGIEGEAKLREFLLQEPVDRNPLYVFTLPARSGLGPLDVMVHTSEGIVIVEFENAGHDPGLQELDYYALIKKSLSRLQTGTTLSQYCQLVTEEVRWLTRLDRVMVYKFHADHHGEVVAESRHSDLPSWLGLHYPAEDIPKSTRDIFKQMRIRPVPDATAPLSELVPLVNPDTGNPLAMTHCILRGVSLMYSEYLQNMNVAASLTMPLLRDGELWGLIACHHSTKTLFPYQTRTAAEFVAQVVSLRIKALEDREELRYRFTLDSVHNQLLAKATQEGCLAALTHGIPNLLQGIEAGGAALHDGEHWWRVGRTPTEAELTSLRMWLTSRPEFTSVLNPMYCTDVLSRDFPEAEAFADVASGVLAVPVARTHNKLLLWFRPETIRTVNWAGNPHDKPTVPGPNGPRLTPRISFQLFVESVRRRSWPWRPAEIEAAQRLRMFVTELLVTWTELRTLHEADRRKNEFLAMLGHELRNPLVPIRNCAEILDHCEVGDWARVHAASAVIDRQLVHLTRLLDDLLDIARITNGAIPLRHELVELQTVIAQATEETRPMRKARQQGLRLSLPEDPVGVLGDTTRLVQVFSNLLANAAKYTHEGGQVILTVTSQNALVSVSIKDNGKGIAAEQLPHIFNAFGRSETTQADTDTSLGVGLNLVRQLVELHNGQIAVQSAGVGQGSEFVVCLPVAPAGAETAPAIVIAPSVPPKNLRILVVDDNPIVLSTTSELLRLLGHEVETAIDGPQALEKARQFRPQAICLDLGLPGMDGYEVVAQLRKDPGAEHTRVIAVSGYGGPEHTRRALEAGFDRLMTKPLTVAALSAALVDGCPS